MIEIDHGNDLISRYAHASKKYVKVGDVVLRGTRIADVGRTGRATGSHLHFEVRQRGAALNPARFLQIARLNGCAKRKNCRGWGYPTPFLFGKSMITGLLKKVFGSRNERLLKQYRRTVRTINALEPQISALSDDQLRAKTEEFRERIRKAVAAPESSPAGEEQTVEIERRRRAVLDELLSRSLCRGS